jgi:hypothetical protein
VVPVPARPTGESPRIPRDADWRREVARTFVYATGQTPEAADALLAEYERGSPRGPEFIRQRPGS